VLSARDSLTPRDRTAKSREISGRLFSLPDFISARTVLFFASFRSEVETEPMIRASLQAGKRVLLPKVKGGELELFEIGDFDRDIAPGAWGIPEPSSGRPAALSEIHLILVPGAAFDEGGNRIGYGAGFYDKLLRTYKGMTMALAFELQIVPHVPTDAHDVPVQKILTEKRVIETSAKMT